MANSPYLPDTTKSLNAARAAASDELETSQKRKWGRVRIESLPCNVGRVLDLSAGGMRVQMVKKLTNPVEIVLGDSSHRLAIRAEVVWQKRKGWKSFEAGISFGELSQEQRTRLVRLMHCSTLIRRDAA